MSKQLNSQCNAELLARINGRHPLIAGYVEEVHRLYNKRRLARGRQWSGTVAAEGRTMGLSADILEELTHGICSRSSAQKNQQQLLQYAATVSRFPAVAEGIAERVLAMCGFKGVGPWRAGGWHVATAWAQSARSSRHAGVGYQQGALANIQATSCQPQVQICGAAGQQQGNKLSVQGRYCTMSGVS
jgi:hypothetical protein